MRAAVAMVTVAGRLEGDDALRRAMDAVLTTRVELRDDIDVDMASALDELYEQVVARGENPEAAGDKDGAGPQA